MNSLTKYTNYFAVGLLLVGIEAAAGALPSPVTNRSFHENGEPSPAVVELGRLLFYDKILSGNQNISCATCHHPFAGTSDGLSVSVGEGGRGLSVTRDTGIARDMITERVPRNSPALFNLAAREFTVFFHDGRVTSSSDGNGPFDSPAGADLPPGLLGPLAVQAMFPVTSSVEMAGNPGENTIADAAASGNLAGPGGVWAQLAKRLQQNNEYVRLFKAAFDDIGGSSDISFVHAANALAAFEGFAWRADKSDFDEYLRGNKKVLSHQAVKGMNLFYGKAGCSGCHSGVFQTDHGFHSIAMPQMGPGKGDGEYFYEDFGRERVTGSEADRYRFRTPSLRNVALTGPWGHAGSYNSLEAVVLHHLDPVSRLMDYDPSQFVVPGRADLDEKDYSALLDPQSINAIALSNELESIDLTRSELEEVLAFLDVLTDRRGLDMRADVPRRVPSGLTIFD